MKQQWYLSDQKQQSVIRNIFNIGRAGSFLPILAPISCVQAAPSTVHSFLPQGLRGGWVAATVLRAEINHNLLSKPSINSRIPKIRQILPVQLLCRWGGRFLHFLLCPLPRILTSIVFSFLGRSTVCDSTKEYT